MRAVRVASHAGNVAVHSAGDDAPLHLVAEVQASRDNEVAKLKWPEAKAQARIEADLSQALSISTSSGLTYAIRDQVESVWKDTVDDLRASRRIIAILQLLLEEDTGLLIVAFENEADDGLTIRRDKSARSAMRRLRR